MSDRKTILVAEDNSHLLKAITVRLESEGYKVVGVQDGYQALEQCHKIQPAVLLLDINMPAGSGLSVQDRMNRNPLTSKIPVIYMTGDTSLALMSQAESRGAFAVLHKPLNTIMLLGVIESAIESCKRIIDEAA